MTVPSSFTTPSQPTKTSSLSDWLDYMQHIHVSAIDMGLSRVLPVAQQLGITQAAKQQAYVFTVAGTNGKGSTTAVISEICQQAGYKTALYQSPHLIDFNERVRINGQAVGDAVLVDAFVQVEQARLVCELTLSFFEMTTLAAMLIFSQAKCDVWVLEVGLGGRLDVVNIINPDLAVITNIGIDHVAWLGDTREKIGAEKAGILRQGAVLIYGEPDMPQSVKALADSLACPIYQIETQYNYVDDFLDNTALAADTWVFSGAHVTLRLAKPKLSLLNTTNAVAAVLASTLPIQPSHINQALQNVRLAGRFDSRALSGRQWLFDVAHNERGMAFLLSQFVPFWQKHTIKYPNAKWHLVFSMLADKDIAKVVSLLAASPLPLATWHIAEIDYPRAATVAQLGEFLTQNNIEDMIEYESLAAAALGVIKATNANDLILVCGSFHTIAEVLIALRASIAVN